MTSVPKILHQLWIGEKPMPSKFMDTWRDKHPDFEYIRWTEQECERRGMQFICNRAIHDMTEINGKADIMRWEILYQYGGVFVDADSLCLEPLDPAFLVGAFAGFEQEKVRPGLVATGTMGFPPKHPLCKDAIAWILKNDVSPERTHMRAWKTVGPGLLTRILNNGRYPHFNVYPSYFFLPVHHSGLTYDGHGKVYAYQAWGSTHLNYDTMNQIELPAHLLSPAAHVSILVSSYNTRLEYVRACLASIMQQTGHFAMELVWIDDGSTDENSKDLKTELSNFVKQTRFTTVKYTKMKRKDGGSSSASSSSVARCMNKALQLASHEIVIKMDSDDIMAPHRIQTQIDFMQRTPDCVLCGAQVGFMYPSLNDPGKTEVKNEVKNEVRGKTSHPPRITWDEFKTQKPPSPWFMNNPTLCFLKSAVQAVGGYDEHPDTTEDWILEITMLKHFEVIYNIDEVLLFYRIHEDQLTFQNKFNTPARVAYKAAVLEKLWATER